MINWLINKWWDWALTREINATPTHQRAPKVERENREQYSIGECVATVMVDRNEVKTRLTSIRAKAKEKEARVTEAAEKAWLATGGLSESFINYVKNTEFEPKDD